MTDTKLIKLEKEIQKKITIPEQKTLKTKQRFDFDKAKKLAQKLNALEMQAHASTH